MKRPAVLLLGPSRDAISGVATHLDSLLGSKLAAEFALEHFQTGSEGRAESLPGRLWRLAASPFALAASIVRVNAALVHLNTSLNARAFWRDIAYLLVARLCGARVIYQVHGGALAEFAAKSRALAAFLRAVLRWPDAIVVLSRSELEACRALVPGQAVELVPNGVDTALYRHERSPSATPALRLVYVGRLAPGKGLLEAIEALRLARMRGTAARLIIAGGGPEEARLRRRVREAGLLREISFAGPCYGERKAKLLSQADALLLASYAEGLPYALLEAMAAGVVPIVTRVGAIPEVVAEGRHGLFVARRDPEAIARAIAALALDRGALARMSAACRKRIAAAYSIERVAADFAALYAALCAARSPGTIF